jgi:hypothetical protein
MREGPQANRRETVPRREPVTVPQRARPAKPAKPAPVREPAPAKPGPGPGPAK